MEARPNPAIKTIASVIALLSAGILIAGILYVPFRASRPPAEEPQLRAHLNTKNSTRFSGQTTDEIVLRISQAVYTAVDETTMLRR